MNKKIIVFITFFFYIFTVLWLTVLNRPIGLHTAQFELLWSYKKWFAGDWSLGKEIVANIVMFVPFGILLSKIFDYSKAKYIKNTVKVVCLATVFSVFIEVLQLMLMRGLFEWDDMVSNTIGAFTGSILYELFMKRTHNRVVWRIVCVVVVFGCFAIINKYSIVDMDSDITPRIFCFQVDEVKDSDGKVQIEGFAFRYEQEVDDFTVVLQSSETGKKVKMKTERSKRTDVNKYFLCNYDYNNSGFTASGEIDAKEEYEVMVNWSGIMMFSTGIYITGTQVYFVPEEEFLPLSGGEDLTEIIKKGTLRVYRPDYHCWVYQLGTALYWIVDKEFTFEDDGSTYIQYQLWTTQEDRLPQQRIEHGWMWDNIGGAFEKYELKGDFGPYRVSCRELPDEYSIAAIETGYYKDGKWIWKNYFRPDYNFLF